MLLTTKPTIGTIIVIIQIIGKIVLHYFGKPHVGKMLKWIESAPKKPSPPHQPHLNSYQCIIIITRLTTINNKSVLGAICWEERAEKFWQNWHFMSKQSSKVGQTMMMAMILVVMMMTRSITCQVNCKFRMKEKNILRQHCRPSHWVGQGHCRWNREAGQKRQRRLNHLRDKIISDQYHQVIIISSSQLRDIIKLSSLSNFPSTIITLSQSLIQGLFILRLSHLGKHITYHLSTQFNMKWFKQ